MPREVTAMDFGLTCKQHPKDLATTQIFVLKMTSLENFQGTLLIQWVDTA
jgi:hypothetical protein